MRDFTYSIYERLLRTMQENGYSCIPYIDFIEKNERYKKAVILRHDVDGKPDHSLEMAKIQYRYGVQGTYYFRNVSYSYHESIIRQLVDMGHEIGVHYEDLSDFKGNAVKAIARFQHFLEKLRAFYPVRTICMHGSPLSKYDNRWIWRHYSYRDYGIIAEPYFDTDFSKVWYLTDTGRGWNNTRFSIRDKVSSAFNIHVRDTHHLVSQFRSYSLPEQIMINIHPQRWTNQPFEWYKELTVQSTKNIFKLVLNNVR